MKKLIFLSAIFAGLLMVSCAKEKIGGTATESVAGEWYVTYDGVDSAGNLIEKDIFGMGHTMLNTYNTAANVDTEMWVDDMENFWEFKAKVSCDTKALTFTSNGEVENYYYDCGVTIEDGRILPGVATTPHGTPADSIVFYVSFSDDPYPSMGYYDKLRCTGYRYTGLAADDD